MQELIEKIQSLEAHVVQLKNLLKNSQLKQGDDKVGRPFDFTKYYIFMHYTTGCDVMRKPFFMKDHFVPSLPQICQKTCYASCGLYRMGLFRICCSRTHTENYWSRAIQSLGENSFGPKQGNKQLPQMWKDRQRS